MGAQGRIVVIGALALAACGSHKSRAHDAAVEAESVEDADDGQLFTVPGFDPEIHYAAVQEAEFPVRQNVMYVDEEFTATRLRVTNTRSDRVGIDVGTYWLARLPGYQYPYPEEGCLPEWPFLIVVPHDEVVVGAGESVELNPSHMFYLGNAERPWPQPSSGLRWELEVQDASNEEALVHLAYAIGDAKDLDFAFAIAGGCSPEPWLTDALLAGKSAADLARVEAMFRDAGLPAAPVFAAARKKRDDLVAQLRDELGTFRATHSFEGLRMKYLYSEPQFTKFFHGDAEVAALVAAYFEPLEGGGRAPLAYTLQALGVASPPVLDALARAADDPSADLRQQVAAAQKALHP